MRLFTICWPARYRVAIRPASAGFASKTTGEQGGIPVLVLTRKSNQSIMIGDDIEVSVLAIMGEKVRIGIQAPRDIPVFRKEVYLEIQQERMAEGGKADVREEVDAALRGLGDNG
jgi:carbon storage regulator